MISYQTENVKMPSIHRRQTTAWLHRIAVSYGKKVGDIAYIFCDDTKILEVNREFLHHDYFTDIITFDDDEGEIISGDIFISLDTVRSNSEMFHTNYDQELHRVIAHGGRFNLAKTVKGINLTNSIENVVALCHFQRREVACPFWYAGLCYTHDNVKIYT